MDSQNQQMLLAQQQHQKQFYMNNNNSSIRNNTRYQNNNFVKQQQQHHQQNSHIYNRNFDFNNSSQNINNDNVFLRGIYQVSFILLFKYTKFVLERLNKLNIASSNMMDSSRSGVRVTTPNSPIKQRKN